MRQAECINDRDTFRSSHDFLSLRGAYAPGALAISASVSSQRRSCAATSRAVAAAVTSRDFSKYFPLTFSVEGVGGDEERARRPLLRRQQEQVKDLHEELRVVARELGRDDARVHGVDDDAGALDAAREGVGEEHVGELRLVVGPRAAEAAALGLEIVPLHLAVEVELRREHHDARGSARLQQREQLLGEQEGADVIDTEGGLKPSFVVVREVVQTPALFTRTSRRS